MKLKYTGFIKEHQDDIAESLSIVDIQKSVQVNDIALPKLTSYLNHGTMLIGWMHYVADLETGQLIVPHSYETDGVWVWPSYFSYYLVKFPHYPLDREFVDHLILQNFRRKFVSKEDVTQLADELVKHLAARYTP